jgi:hypothetical protein
MTDRDLHVERRRTVRNAAAAMAGLISLLYFLIAFQVVTVLDNPEDQTVFGLITGGAFLLGALMILFTDNRVIWGLGAGAQALIIAMYFDLAAAREPAYEPWGIFIRVLQVLLFGALVYLTIRPKTPAAPETRAEVAEPARQ